MVRTRRAVAEVREEGGIASEGVGGFGRGGEWLQGGSGGRVLVLVPFFYWRWKCEKGTGERTCLGK